MERCSNAYIWKRGLKNPLFYDRIYIDRDGGKMSDKYIEEILNELKNNGSEINHADEIINTANEIVSHDISLEEALDSVSKDLLEETYNILTKKNKYGIDYITGISTCIYLPDFKGNGEYKLKIIGGSGSRDVDLPVNSETVFDVAAITSVFTLLLLFKFEQEGILDLDTKISDINPNYQGLEDYTFNDLIRLHGVIYTDGRVNEASSKEEAIERLHSAFLKNNTRTENNFNDLCSIIAGETLAKFISERMGKQMTFEDVMNEYLIKPLGLKNTMFNPTTTNIAGNGNQLGLVHDPKARILGGAIGSAGLFTTSDDLALLARHMYSLGYVNKNYIDRMGEITFPESKFAHKGNFGIYVKHPQGLDKTFTPSEFSKGSFSHQGWTGSLATFDPNNMIHQNMLVNAIYEDKEPVELDSEGNPIKKVVNDKPAGFVPAFDPYIASLTQHSLLMLVIKKYYDKYYGPTNDIDSVKTI